MKKTCLRPFVCTAALVVSLSSVSFIVSAADKAPPISTVYSADHIAGGTHVIHGPLDSPNPQNQGFMNNPGIILTTEGVVIIDPGSTVQVGEMVLNHAKKLSDLPVVAAFSTHVHGDHWLGAQAIKEAYPDAKLYAHPALTQEAKDGEAGTWIDLMLSLTEGASSGTIAVIPDLPVNDGDIIKIGDKTFAITHKGQAHTKTDIMIHIVEDDVYFMGDNVFNGRMGRMDDGSYVGLNTTLDAALEKSAAYYVPGHGPTGDKDVVLAYQGLIAGIYTYAQEYYEEGLSDFEMKPLIAEKLKRWHSWPDFEDTIGRLVSFAALEAEAHAFD